MKVTVTLEPSGSKMEHSLAVAMMTAEVSASAIVDRRSRRVTAFEPFGSSAVPLQSDPMA